MIVITLPNNHQKKNRHLTYDTNFDGDNGKEHDQGAYDVLEQKQRDDDHDGRGDKDRLQGLRHDGKVLIDVNEKGMEYGDLQFVRAVSCANFA